MRPWWALAQALEQAFVVEPWVVAVTLTGGVGHVV